MGYDETESIEVVVGEKLKAIKRTVATAESCTGGKIAQQLTAIAGASAYFKGAIVAYETKMKEQILQVTL